MNWICGILLLVLFFAFLWISADCDDFFYFFDLWRILSRTVEQQNSKSEGEKKLSRYWQNWVTCVTFAINCVISAGQRTLPIIFISWRLSSVKKCCFRIQYLIVRSFVRCTCMYFWQVVCFFALCCCCCFNKNINISSIRLVRNVYIFMYAKTRRILLIIGLCWLVQVYFDPAHTDYRLLFYWHGICLPHFFSFLCHFVCMYVCARARVCARMKQKKSSFSILNSRILPFERTVVCNGFLNFGTISFHILSVIWPHLRSAY